MIHAIPKLDQPQRLDLYLSKLYPQTSRNYWKKNLDKLVKVEGKKSKKGLQVWGGESLHILKEPQIGPDYLVANQDLDLEVLYQDDFLLAFNKTSGMHCIPVQEEENNTLVNAMLARYPEQRKIEASLDCGLLQRLDTQTSGILLAARQAGIKKKYQQAQKKDQVFKSYLAWVEGQPSQSEGLIKQAIAHHPKDKSKMILVPEPEKNPKLRARPAISQWQVLKTQEQASLVRLGIFQGRRHQLRLHMASLGHPIWGDKIYGSGQGARLLLHAESIRLKHPKTGKKLFLQAQSPADFKASV